MLRLGRIVRLIRMVRLIASLKAMVYLILASLGSFFWTVCLMLMMMFCVAVYFTELATELQSKNASHESIQGILSHWGSLGNSVLSLYMAISGGDDWRNFIDVFVGAESPYLLNTIVFSCYIAFATLVMLNLVTGVFVEGAARFIKEDKESEIMRIANRIFLSADIDENQELNRDEFVDLIGREAMTEYFDALGISHSDTDKLFDIFDDDGGGTVSLSEFLLGCTKLAGPARATDLVYLKFHQKLNSINVEEVRQELGSLVTKVSAIIKGVESPAGRDVSTTVGLITPEEEEADRLIREELSELKL